MDREREWPFDEVWVPHQRDTSGTWFLFDPAIPPFKCTEAAARIWYGMEREMWQFFVERTLSDEVEPLF
jgi:hypothetical protein